MNADVAVIGAGPAGSALAALLASRGVSVALVDRDTFPRDKLCGEFLSYDALPVADLLGVRESIEAHGAPPIGSCRIVGRRHTLEFDLPHPARGVSRLLLDELLFRAAVDRGARGFDGWTAESIDGTRVTIRRGDETRTIAARLLAGAWGRWGRFDTQLGRPFAQDRSHRSFGFKRHYRAARAGKDCGLPARTSPGFQPGDFGPGKNEAVGQDARPHAGWKPAILGTIELYSFNRGYLGVNDVEDGITNICGLVDASRLTGHRGRWESFVETIRAEEPAIDSMYARHLPAQEGFLSSEPVIFRGRSAVDRGVFMIGDASGIVDPLTGNGMAMAMQSALLAAPMIIRALSGQERSHIEAEYCAAHDALFRPRIRWSRAIAALLSRPTLLDASLRFGSSAIGRSLVRRTRARISDVARLLDGW